MDVDVAVKMRFGVDGIEHKHVVELFGALRTVFEHGAHGRVAVDIGVFALDIVFVGRLICQLLIRFHQARAHVAHTGALRAVENILLGGAGMSALNERSLDRVLDLLDRGAFISILLVQIGRHLPGKRLCHLVIVAAERLGGFKNRGCDFIRVKQDAPPVALDNRLDHLALQPLTVSIYCAILKIQAQHLGIL